MNLDMTVILALVSFIIGLLTGISLIRPSYSHYSDRYRYPDLKRDKAGDARVSFVPTEIVDKTPEDARAGLVPTEIVDKIAEKEHLADLEHALRWSYSFMHDYENIFRLSNDPTEKLQAKQSIENRLKRTRETLSKYIEQANEIGITVPADIPQVCAHFEDISSTEADILQALAHFEDISSTENTK